ncbi:MAG: protoheme IX farnesyltransferase [Chloroflexi bacterium]|nr:protoheme IX farnesyltransferase [Chloroflexota bacterium]
MTSGVRTQPATASTAGRLAALRERLAMLAVLFKLRVVTLLLFAALGGAMLGSGGALSWGAFGLLMLTGGMSAAGASALNQVIERDRDHNMTRTRRRPLVTGQISPRAVLLVGGGMVLLASGIAWAVGNPALAIWLGFGALIYVGVYTIWLKPRSPLNVVIGGAAGSAAIISGGAAAGAWNDPGVIGLALLLFTWSPIHFWSLALVYREDYRRTGLPMLPVVASQDRALFWMLAHALATGLFGLLLALHPALGWAYLLPVGPATLWMLRESARLRRDYSGKRALRVFTVSNVYLSIVLLAIVVVTLVVGG